MSTVSNFKETEKELMSQPTMLNTVEDDTVMNLVDEDIENFSTELQQPSLQSQLVSSFHILSPLSCSSSSSASVPTQLRRAGLSKKRRKGEENTHDALLTAIQEIRDSILAGSSCQGHHDLFGKGIGKQLKKLDDYKKSC